MLTIFKKNFILIVNGVLSMLVVWISNFIVKVYIASDNNTQLLVINFILGILFLLTFIISGFDENYTFDRHLVIKLISCLFFYTGGYVSVIITRYSGFHFTTFNHTISKIGWYEIIIILIFMIWILLDVSFEYEEKFDIDQERFQNFSESMNFNQHSPTQSFDTHSSDIHSSDTHSFDVHDTSSRVPANFFVKRKIVRIRVESRAKFLGRKIELSNFELSQPTFNSRFNQDRQIMQINASSSDNMDVNFKEFINVVNTTNSQETVTIPSISQARYNVVQELPHDTTINLTTLTNIGETNCTIHIDFLMKKDLKSPSGWKTKGYIPIILKSHEDYKIIKEAKFDKRMTLGYRLFPPHIDKLTEDIYQLPNTHSCGELTYDAENSGNNDNDLSVDEKFLDGGNIIDNNNINRNIYDNGNDQISLDYNNENRIDDIYLDYNDYIDNRHDFNDDNISHYSLSDNDDIPQTPGSVSYPINIINTNNRFNDDTLDSPNSNDLICNEIEFIYLTIPKDSLLDLMDSLDRLTDDDIRSSSSPGFGFEVDSTLKGIFYKIIKVEDKDGFAYQRRLSGEYN
ncbi:27283_t:CDS:2 [Gigaspora margarita]|uniref:27283_t:CDS:1 n=1 Tax=Gigaspora margarita TaxID=4874 RepID=A0ABN7UEL4_GIGMA|nr:27283_t:CDS:2 [Gigaspora margarita]